VYIEIEYLGNLIKNLQFERFYFDRPHYYSIKGMQGLFSKGGLKLTSIKEITPHGGSLRLKFNLDAHAIFEDSSVREFLEKEQELISLEKIDDFSNVVRAEAHKLVAILEDLKLKGKNVIGYGSPARLATITNFCNIDENLISVVFEDSPLKIGSYTPGQHIPIKGSQELEDTDFDCIIVFAYEYIKSIKEKTGRYNIPHYQPIPFAEIG
jgi:methylation protein EvaC